METNYIIHLNSSFKRFTDDEKATPFHISLYMALFHKWNNAKFRNPISIARDDLMFLSKIGSANTYTKCLKELDKWGYIKYTPSHSYHVGSKIYMYTFSTTKKTTTIKTTNNAIDISSNKTITKTLAQDVRPYKNTLNNTNKTNIVNDNSPIPKNNNLSIPKNEVESKRKKVAQKKVEGLPEIPSESLGKVSLSNGEGRKGEVPTLEEIKNYFTGKLSSEFEGEKFFNYFESNGWLVGGKTPMKNWQAAANNWMLNSIKFSKGKSNQFSKSEHPAGKLHAETNKNYNEPL